MTKKISYRELTTGSLYDIIKKEKEKEI